MNRSGAILQANTSEDKGPNMHPDVENGVDAELKFFLKPGWKHRVVDGRFHVTLPATEPEQSAARAELYSEVWRVARLVAYTTFSSIRKNPDGSYTLKSHMASGEGYEMIFGPN